jgi:ATP synthase protein I
LDKEAKKTAIQLAYASSVGIAMALAIFGGLFLGIWLDGKLGTKPVFTLLLLLIGIAAGFRNLYLLIKPYFKDEQPQNTDVKSEPHRERPPSEED